MILDAFDYQPLRGGLLLVKITVNAEPMFDAIGRVALARTSIIGANITIELSSALADRGEVSISIYHEVLEAATVGAMNPPAAVCELNEAGFDASARNAHATLGEASPDTLNRMLADFGF